MILEKLNSKNAIWIKQKLGDYVSHDVIWSKFYSGKELKSVEEINNLDRIELSDFWYYSFIKENHYQEDRVWDVIKNNYECLSEWFIEDVAVYIDMRLPQAYIKTKEHLDIGPSQVKIKLDTDGNLPYGLKYKYKENYNSLVKPVGAPGSATEKQLRYIEDLAEKKGYHFNHHEITLKKASEFISFFKNMDSYSEPEDFDMYFTKNSC